jgi:transcription-repair coupling factor (superfamily II helicase)
VVDWCDRYGSPPPAAQKLVRIVELKQIAKSLGFSRIKPEAKQHVILEFTYGEFAGTSAIAFCLQHR